MPENKVNKTLVQNENSLLRTAIALPSRAPRQGWEEQFRQMAANGDDKLLDEEPLVLTEWEASEWEW